MTVSLSEEFQDPLDEVLVQLEHTAVPSVGIDDELAVGESSIEVNGVLGTIASPSRLMTSTSWWMARSARFADPIGGWPRAERGSRCS
jgi:hypothetical protein